MQKPLLFSKGVVFNWFNKYEWHVASRDKECYNLYEEFLLIEALYQTHSAKIPHVILFYFWKCA